MREDPFLSNCEFLMKVFHSRVVDLLDGTMLVIVIEAHIAIGDLYVRKVLKIR